MWKRIVLKAVMMLVIFMGLASYGAYLTGRPVPLFNSAIFEKLKAKMHVVFDSVSSANVEQTARDVIQGEEEQLLFKWKGESGIVHFGDKPANGAIDVEVIRASELRGNIVTATKIPEIRAKEQQQNGDVLLTNPYSPEGVKEIMDKAKEVQQIMDERVTRQQEILEGF